jgi:hypothetical protein
MPECKIDISFKVIRVEVFEIASLDNFIGSDLGLEFFLAAYIITYYQAMITYSNMAYSRHYKFIRFVREEKINSSIAELLVIPVLLALELAVYTGIIHKARSS